LKKVYKILLSDFVSFFPAARFKNFSARQTGGQKEKGSGVNESRVGARDKLLLACQFARKADWGGKRKS